MEGYNPTYPYDEETMDSSKILKELKKEAKERMNKKEAERQRHCQTKEGEEEERQGTSRRGCGELCLLL